MIQLMKSLFLVAVLVGVLGSTAMADTGGGDSRPFAGTSYEMSVTGGEAAPVRCGHCDPTGRGSHAVASLCLMVVSCGMSVNSYGDAGTLPGVETASWMAARIQVLGGVKTRLLERPPRSL